MRNKILILFILLLTAGSLAAAEVPKHIVFLTNKDNNPYTLSKPSEFLSARAIERRQRYNLVLDIKDLPVTPSYVSQIRATGATVVYTLKWFNAVVVQTGDQAVLNAIAALPFTDHIDQVYPKSIGSGKDKFSFEESLQAGIVKTPDIYVKSLDSTIFDYGQAANQVQMISVDKLHEMGFTGRGIWIAILDAGFCRVDQISAFDSLWDDNRILGTRDFNLPGNNVFADTMHTHGTSVLSTMGANLPGQIVGTAPHASYWLIRTEVGWYEDIVEEYNWAAGAEFADSVGADVINSSLGYTTFDNPAYNHTYADMNGHTTPITIAADLAAGRGLIVVNSAGNDGQKTWHYIGAPADGDSVFSIGAVDAAGLYAPFSSKGPTYDGRVKPDVASQGKAATIVSSSGAVTQGSGTSFSSPIMAGAMACLRQALPLMSPEELRNGVRNTASRATEPDSLTGYGIPNMMNALTLLSVPQINPEKQEKFSLYPVPFSGSPWLQSNIKNRVPVRIEVLSVAGQSLFSGEFSIEGSSSLKLEQFAELSPGIYFVRISSGRVEMVIKAVKW